MREPSGRGVRLTAVRPRLVRRLALVAAVNAAPVAIVACGTVKTVNPGSTATSVASTDSTGSTTTDTGSVPVTVPATGPDVDAQRAALEAAERQWAATGVNDYRFTLTNNCFCVPPFSGPIEIVVVDGTAVSMTLGPDSWDPSWAGSTVPPEQAEWIAATADELFETIRTAIGQKDFRAVYDAATGFPVEFYSDPLPDAVDDEYGFTTAAFEAT